MAETLRLQQAAQQQRRALDQLETNQEKVNALMVRFDTLMAQGQYNVLFNGGTGNIAAAIAPFAEAHTFAQQARALDARRRRAAGRHPRSPVRWARSPASWPTRS